MFNLQSFSSQKSLVADGNIAVALNRIRSLLTKLLHSPETGVIYLTNNSVSNIPTGSIVSLSTLPYTCYLSSAVDGVLQPLLVRGIGISIMNRTIAPGEGGYFRIAGEVLVLMESALGLVEGSPVYVSDSVAGTGTDVQPEDTSWIRQIGIIKDAGMYVPTNLYCKILIEKCCEYQLGQ
jgi:hypothetical protein